MAFHLLARSATFGLALHVAMSEPVVLCIPQRDQARSWSSPPTVDVSADGRYVAFASFARLVPADTDAARDVYVLDRDTRHVTWESDGDLADYDHPRISGDGRFLVFEGAMRPAGIGIFLRDRRSGVTRLLRPAPNAGAPTSFSRNPEISADGRTVVFVSTAADLATEPDPQGNGEDVFVMDVGTWQIRRIPAPGSTANVSFSPSVSTDGASIAFASGAPIEVRAVQRARPSTRGVRTTQIYVHDLRLGTTTLASGAAHGRPADGAAWHPRISADGRYVAFASEAANLVPGDNNDSADVFLYDRHTRSTTLISRGASGRPANGTSARPAVSRDARYVAFQSDASNLICAGRCPRALDDINLLWDVFVYDRQTDTMTLASADAQGGWMAPSVGPALDASGQVLAFSSRHPLDALDDRNDFDLFIRAR